jgi:hypothetical protein
MKSTLAFCFGLTLLFSRPAAASVTPPNGSWTFDDSTHLLAATIGSPLVLVGSHASIDGPAAGDRAVRIGVGSSYAVTHGIAPNGGGSRVNEYTVQIDFRIRATDVWHTFFQFTPANNDDGEYFIAPGGTIGVAAAGYGGYTVKAGEWYRMLVVVKNGTSFTTYLDGQSMLDGTPQAIDGRFSLGPSFKFFADNDGEDGEIDCSALALWDHALTPSDAADLGGFGHTIGSPQLMLLPFLQSPTPSSLVVSWHDTSSVQPQVHYGLTPSLGKSAAGTNELIAAPYRWQSATLTGLTPNTEYYYAVSSGSGTSPVYRFRTQPDASFHGKLRFLLLSDTHSPDSTVPMQVIRAAQEGLTTRFGPDLQNQVNAVLHSGDIVMSGNVTSQYTDLFFRVMSGISPALPFLLVPGNHEGEDARFYGYLKSDLFSAFPGTALNEKIWSTTIANTMIIGLNTNITSEAGTQQKAWLSSTLKQAMADTAIDFVICLFHHPPFSELWHEVNDFDGGSNYIRDEILPLCQTCPKVVQLSYGHTHGFERGTIESDLDSGDFRIVCGGGGGGYADRWGLNQNGDYAAIQIALDHHFYQIIEIDAAQKTFDAAMISIGNEDYPLPSREMDRWHRKILQPPPSRPSILSSTSTTDSVVVSTSPYAGVDSLMSVRLQYAADTSFAEIVLDTLVHWKNIYGADQLAAPIDLRRGISLTRIALPRRVLPVQAARYCRVRYRDHNLRWSSWSAPSQGVTGIGRQTSDPDRFALLQNYPNPFNPSTVITYILPVTGRVTLTIVDLLGREVTELVHETEGPGEHRVEWQSGATPSGVYFVELRAGGSVAVNKILLLR